MTKLLKYERREYYDNYGTGNYTEDKSAYHTMELSEETAKKFTDMWCWLGLTHYETSKAHFYEEQTDARHFTQYILYK